MKDFFKRAEKLRAELTANRRALHQTPELGSDLYDTVEYVKQRLSEMGIEAEEICKSGLSAQIGGKRPGRTILLRTDMDALPMEEHSGLEFASQNGNAHACGHDLHMAMMLGAARMLKECENELDGVVKLMFQPGEETFDGALEMMEAGILENPKPDCALDMHVFTEYPKGMVGCRPGIMSASCDGFVITIVGKGCHGAQPHKGIDPINVGVHLHLALQSLISRETPPAEMAALTVCRFHAGSASNIIPETAELSGTLRTYDKLLRKKLTQRIEETAKSIAEAFGASARVEWSAKVPAIESNPELSKKFTQYLKELDTDCFYFDSDVRMTASDDFGHISEQIPSVFFLVSAVPGDEKEALPNHNPGVVFDEGILPLGAAIFAQCAFCYLRDA